MAINTKNLDMPALRGLSPSAAQVYVILLEYMGDEFFVAISQKTAAALTNKSIPTVFRAIEELVREELITLHHVGNLIVYGHRSAKNRVRWVDGLAEIKATVVLSEAEQINLALAKAKRKKTKIERTTTATK